MTENTGPTLEQKQIYLKACFEHVLRNFKEGDEMVLVEIINARRNL